MKIIPAADYQDMSRIAAEFIAAQMKSKENSIFGLATGGTVVEIYHNLVQRYQNGELDFSQIRTVNLDEYVGLGPNHPQSYRYFMEQHLFSLVNLAPDSCHIPDGLAKSIPSECSRYDQLIQQLGGVDLQILGLGTNGHIGFNEPGESFESTTHCVQLSESTRMDNSRFFHSIEEVPIQAITMGTKTILSAKKILLCVSGQAKAEILQEVLFGPVTPSVPGSVLQNHPDVTVIADAEARCMLQNI